MQRVAGVDGARGGWLVALGDLHRGTVHVRDLVLVPHAHAVLDATQACAAIAIDMPIGLPDDVPRTCDQLARAELGARRSSVFPAPARAVLDATDYADANARSRAAMGRGLSKQAWHIVPRIRDLDAALRARPADAARVAEAHPELAFAALAGAPCAYPKRVAEGYAERRALLDGPLQGMALDMWRARWLRRDVADDDVLDALVLLTVAARMATGEARSLPPQPPCDACGLPMRMVV